jgi:SPX domain protein involved in polyphosphate accumulation
MTLDTHGASGDYRVTSLYYDSPDLTCYRSKVDGILYRRKVRIRTYGLHAASDDDAIALEIKQRINRTVQKRRLELPLPLAEQLCAGTLDLTDLTDLSPDDHEVASEVRYLVDALDLRPTAITAYQRRAFMGNRYDSGLRITFDTQLCGRMHALRVNEDANNHVIAPPDVCVMEVKANDAVPDWVTSLLARHECQLQRVSKYCAVVSKLAGLPVASPLLLGS